MVGMLSLLFYADASANVREVPVKAKMSLPAEAPVAGEPFAGEFDIVAGRPTVVTHVALQGPGWIVRFVRAPGTQRVTPTQPLHIEFVATPVDPAEPLLLHFEYDGQSFETTIDLSPDGHERRKGVATVAPSLEKQTAPFPGVDLSKPRPEPASASAATHRLRRRDRPVDDSTNEATGQARGGRNRDVRVYGRLTYQRSDGTTIGADGVTVRVYDEDLLSDDLLASEATDASGYYDMSFSWPTCFLCESDPDIFVEFETANSQVTVEHPDIFEENYNWNTSTHDNVSEAALDMGSLQPPIGDHPATHIITDVTRTWRWLLTHEGYNTPSVDVQWPDTGIATYYNPVFQEIHIRADSQWHEVTHAHEYGHHWIKQYGNFQIPFYCGIPFHCDDILSFECAHCMWCSETAEDAWTEGWPDWFSDVVVRSFLGEYGIASTSSDCAENVLTCNKAFASDSLTCTVVNNASDSDPTLNDPYKTEGLVAALLRDIEDTNNETEPKFPNGNGEDQLALGTDEIFQVSDLDAPVTPAEFLSKFKARYPAYGERFCKTAANNGYQIADGADPGVVTNIAASTDFSLACLTGFRNVVSWTRADDDCSGVVGYSVVISPSPEMPDTVKELADITNVKFCPSVAGHYYNIRSVDRAGKWSSSYVSVPILSSYIPVVPTLDLRGIIAMIVGLLMIGVACVAWRSRFSDQR